MRFKWIAGRIIGGIMIFTITSFLLGFVTMSLWNALVPELFHGPVITFWQAIGLFILSKILFHGWGHGRWGHRWKHDRWKQRLEMKLGAMEPEEREKFKKRWERCYGWCPGEEREPAKTEQA
jgi:hypothetical protein